MKCDEARTLAAIDVFGTLLEWERKALDDHLRACPACTEAAVKSAGVRQALEIPADLPEPDWERSWNIIAAATWARPFRVWRPGFALRWGFAAASLALAFVLGLVLGRSLPSQSTQARAGVTSELAAPPAVVPAATESPLPRYADTLEPMLVDFVDRGIPAFSPDAAQRKRQALRSMVGQTRVLRTLAAQAGAADLEALFAEIEPLLVSMANLAPDDRDSTEWLKKMIGERGIRAKVRKLAQTQSAL